GVPGIFALTGVLALVAIGVVRWIVPDAPPASRAPEAASLSRVLREPELVRLNVGIFVLHAVLMAIFVVVPIALVRAGLPSAPRGSTGSATGVYSSVQFLGTFAGGAAGGAIAEHAGSVAVLAACFVATLAWIAVAWKMDDFVPAASAATRN